MKSIWNPTLDQVIEAMELAQARGKKPGESYEDEFFEVMEKYNQKPCGNTELNKEEFLSDLAQRGGNILDVSIDDTGKSTYTHIKQKIEE